MDHREPERRFGEVNLLGPAMAALRRELGRLGVDATLRDQWMIEQATRFRGDVDDLEEWAAGKAKELLP